MLLGFCGLVLGKSGMKNRYAEPTQYAGLIARVRYITILPIVALSSAGDTTGSGAFRDFSNRVNDGLYSIDERKLSMSGFARATFAADKKAMRDFTRHLGIEQSERAIEERNILFLRKEHR